MKLIKFESKDGDIYIERNSIQYIHTGKDYVNNKIYLIKIGCESVNRTEEFSSKSSMNMRLKEILKLLEDDDVNKGKGCASKKDMMKMERKIKRQDKREDDKMYEKKKKKK
jgi:hypothetical protein